MKYFYLLDIGAEFRYDGHWYVKTSRNGATPLGERKGVRFPPHAQVDVYSATQLKI